ncbi:hypothetical protein DMP08_05320 [Paraeggerthella hongkongensis]|uniref:Uncharacterized protein n=1 Tax=Paraeggerthella hongkongensis TaxID=230658 RepID=A0A3N0BE50_9ACTN|nr:hypothetical protein DMP08_05320 [Paraeggerthella hongkongensis]
MGDPVDGVASAGLIRLRRVIRAAALRRLVQLQSGALLAKTDEFCGDFCRTGMVRCETVLHRARS